MIPPNCPVENIWPLPLILKPSISIMSPPEAVQAKPQAVLVKSVDNPVRYGVVNVEGEMVKRITDKPRETESNLINTGIYAFNKEVFRFIESELGITDALNNMIAAGQGSADELVVRGPGHRAHREATDRAVLLTAGARPTALRTDLGRRGL